MDEIVNYILDLDFLTTKEFCEKHKIPILTNPNMTASELANEFIRLDAVKYRIILEKAKEVKRKLKQ